MDEYDTRAIVAAYFEAQARRRGESAAESPDDVRERRSARGILDVADYVRELPDGDARLDRITSVCVEVRPEPGATLAVGATADEIALRFRYDDPLEAPDALLDRFAAAAEAGAAARYAEGRTPAEIAEDLGSGHPTRALLAVRFMADHLDPWEDEAVSRARAAGWSWERIAAVLGRTRQSVWSKHRETERSSPIVRAPRAVAALAKAAITRVPHGGSHGADPVLDRDAEAAAAAAAERAAGSLTEAASGAASDLASDNAPASVPALAEGVTA